VRVPAALRSLADNQASVHIELAAAGWPDQARVGEVLAALRTLYPGVYHAVLDERGAVRPHVNVYVGAQNIRFAAGLATPVSETDEVWILPAVSGG
jgi:molybdopterin converting factor small subunit